MSNRGFTLLEVLASMAILVVVLTIVYATFASVTSSMEQGREAADLLRKQQYLVRTLRGELSGVYTYAHSGKQTTQPTGNAIIFVGEDLSDPTGDTDRLTFLSAAPLAGGKGIPGDLKQVVIEVVDGASDMGLSDALIPGRGEQGRVLQISEMPIQQGEAQVQSAVGGLNTTSSSSSSSVSTLLDSVDPQTVAELGTTITFPVDSVNIQYYDGASDQWYDEWDYDNAGQMLPWAVRIDITFARSDAQRQADRQAGLKLDEDPDLEVLSVMPLGIGRLTQVQSSSTGGGRGGSGIP